MCTRTLKLEVTGSELDSDVRVWGTERGSVLACSVTAGGPDDVVDESLRLKYFVKAERSRSRAGTSRSCLIKTNLLVRNTLLAVSPGHM